MISVFALAARYAFGSGLAEYADIPDVLLPRMEQTSP